MSGLTRDERAELEALRARVARLEAEHAEQIAAANAAVAAAQERLYWLDRFRIDLNAIMAKPVMVRVGAVLRTVRGPVRLARRILHALKR